MVLNNLNFWQFIIWACKALSQFLLLLIQVLKQDPNNGFAKVHYGFILKTERNDLDGGIKYMSEGIATKEPGVTDGRFYLHLGDALQRTGQNDEVTFNEVFFFEGSTVGHWD